MTTKLRMFLRKNRKPYWGVLARDPAYKQFHKADNFTSLLQGQVQNAEAVPVSVLDRVSGKEKPGQSSEDITV
jgi:hypothetical protein